MSAKDKGTNKEHRITIQASGGLSDDDIEQMVRDAEDNAEADKERKELVEAKNQAESLIHSTEKSLEEHSEKVDPSTVEVIELSIKALKETLETDNASSIQARSQDLQESAMKLGEAIYQAQADEAGPVAPEGEYFDEDSPKGVDEDIVDADFEDLGKGDR